jgi:hypothetical protein
VADLGVEDWGVVEFGAVEFGELDGDFDASEVEAGFDVEAAERELF